MQNIENNSYFFLQENALKICIKNMRSVYFAYYLFAVISHMNLMYIFFDKCVE